MPTDRLRWHHWPDGSVVYDRVEGATIALSPLSVALLSLLRQDPTASKQELAERYRVHSGVDADLQAVSEALKALKNNGLA